MPYRIALAIFAICLFLTSLASGAATTQPNGDILIEAEKPSRKESPQPDFIKTVADPFASGGASALRFFVGGTAYYDFDVPEDGVYRVWLRYATKGAQTLESAVYRSGPNIRIKAPKPTKTKAPLTGALDGRGAWKWVRLHEGKLSQGRNTISLKSASMRPDCFIVTQSEEEPSWMAAKAKAELDEKTLALLAKPIRPIRPDWLTEFQDYEIPDWYDKWRVCMHTRLGPPNRTKDIFLNAAEGFSSLGLHVYSRHIKSGAEGAWWSSKVGYVEPWAVDRNYAKEIIDNAHNAGCRLLVYHRHMEDNAMADEHPDWLCRDSRGAHMVKRGKRMCFSSPYRDFFEKRLLELVDMGADGFYFDEIHMPKTCCWCDNCKKAFKKLTGLDHPDREDPDDPIWMKLRDYNNHVIEQTFLQYRRAIHARNPECVLLIGTNMTPDLIDRHMTHRLYRLADAIKSEFNKGAGNHSASRFAHMDNVARIEPDVGMALGYTLSRDSADGRPAHIWIPRLRDETSAVYSCAGVIAHGCIANPDHKEAEIPNPGKFLKAIELGNRVSPGFAGMRPSQWALVHYPEAARDAMFPDEEKTWKEAMYPMVGAYRTLLREHLPVGVITDSQLEEGMLDGCRVLFLPARRLTAAMGTAVKAFSDRGGLVITQQPEWRWHEGGRAMEAASKAFLEAIDEAAGSPVEPTVTGGPEKMHAVFFKSRTGENRLTVALVNDFSWVDIHRPPPGKELPANPGKGLEKAPPPCEGVRISLTLDEPPRVTELVSGRTLTARKASDGYEIAVPTFEAMAVVVAEY